MKKSSKNFFEFFENDDISRMSPGIKDRVAIRNNGNKEHIQKRHMYMSLKETHALFRAENENIKISRSKFASLRALHVLLSRQTPANLCMCIYHQNVILALKKLSVCSANVPVYANKFADSCLQSPDDPASWFSECHHEECGFKKKYQLQCDSDPSENIVEWKQWQDINGRMKQLVQSPSVMHLYDHLCLLMPSFLTHIFIKRQQHKSLESENKK